MKKVFWISTLAFIVFTHKIHAQELKPQIKGDSIIYNLEINYQRVNYTGKDRKAITVNGSIPAPTLYFEEGKWAVINIENKMDKEETSVHWHGIILPNIQDGVPYLTTPPIRPKTRYTFRFPLTHSGTYWYHSHTGLQEQRGVYGGIVIKPKKQTVDY